jgi:hypothetical protein
LAAIAIAMDDFIVFTAPGVPQRQDWNMTMREPVKLIGR